MSFIFFWARFRLGCCFDATNITNERLKIVYNCLCLPEHNKNGQIEERKEMQRNKQKIKWKWRCCRHWVKTQKSWQKRLRSAYFNIRCRFLQENLIIYFPVFRMIVLRCCFIIIRLTLFIVLFRINQYLDYMIEKQALNGIVATISWSFVITCAQCSHFRQQTWNTYPKCSRRSFTTSIACAFTVQTWLKAWFLVIPRQFWWKQYILYK